MSMKNILEQISVAPSTRLVWGKEKDFATWCAQGLRQ
jgi:hypothetical protein